MQHDLLRIQSAQASRGFKGVSEAVHQVKLQVNHLKFAPMLITRDAA